MFDDFYYEDDDDEDDDDDKDKKHRRQRCRQQQMKSHLSIYNSRGRRICIAVLVVLVIMFFVHAAPYTSPDVEIILDANKMRLEKVERSSVILDVLKKRKSDGGEQHHQHQANLVDDVAEEPAIPAFRLITEFKNGIYFYNIHEPIESWWPFDCIPTKMQQSLNTMVCIHDPKFDKQISQQLKENGMWEPTNVRSFLNQLRELNDTNVIDVGANIGIYSLLAAKLGRHVIAVEPLHENLNRMHKAAHLEGVQSKIIALVNAVANERTQLKLSIMDYNIGGTYVLQPDLVDPEQKFSPTSSSVIVNSILLDDLVDVAEARIKYNRSSQVAVGKQQSAVGTGTRTGTGAATVSEKRRFVMKLDIEGFEPYVFEKASRLFDTYQIPAVFMEFGKSVQKLASQRNETSPYGLKIRNMLEFFKSRNYEPYEVNGINKLDYSNWRYEWPWDVYFKKCDVIFCPNHVYRVSGENT